MATHAQVEATGFIEVLDDSQSEHLAKDIDAVMPFLDAEELIEMRGMVQKANNALQGKLASDAQALHLAKLEVEKAASSAQLNYKKADATAQAATKQAMASKAPKDATEAVKQKKLAADAKAKHTKLQKKQSEAQIKASAAMKKATDAGATVKLPSLPSSTSTSSTASTASTSSTAATTASSSTASTASVGASTSPPPPAPLKDPPGVVKPKQPTKLETILKDRRNKRIQKEAHDLRKKYEEAKVEKQNSDYILSKAMAKYQKVKTAEAEANSAKSAARKEEQLDEAKIIKSTTARNIAKTDYKSVKKAEKLAKAMVRGEKVEVEVASSLAKTGSAKRNLKKSDKKREARNARLKKAKADTVSFKLAVAKAKAATTAAKAGLVSKQDTLQKLQRGLAKADHQFANAVYKIKKLRRKDEKVTEDKDQAKAEDKLDTKTYKSAHELATAAALKANQAKNGNEAALKALLRDPKEAKKEALLRVKDQNGISDLGTSLIAPKGAVSKDYISKFNKMPLSHSGRNPILEAEARASLKDTSADAALKVATTPGPAAVAAAKISVQV